MTSTSAMPAPPLYVDLDGTLVRTDTLQEILVKLLKARPWLLLPMLWWICRGKVYFKQQILMRINVDPSTLPYNQDLLRFLEAEKSAGRTLYLATASHRKAADVVAQHVGLFADVLATENTVNLAGANKAAALLERHPDGRFCYAGNSSADLPVWEAAESAILVDTPGGVARRARRLTTIASEFPPKLSKMRAWIRALRVHQWSKNTLIFLPPILAHKWSWMQSGMAFLAFCLCASSVYIANDLLDLEADRHHAKKKNRAFAAGHLQIGKGVVAAFLLLAVGISLGSIVSTAFMFMLMGYYGLTWGYSMYFKSMLLVDVVILALLYTWRILAGAVATQISISFWLLAFSVFVFYSLALAKRAVELQDLSGGDKTQPSGRGYYVNDQPIIEQLGVASGLLSVLILTLYLNSSSVRRIYVHPEYLWAMCVYSMYWISRIWIKVHRRELHHDPIVFALKDRTSLFIAVLTMLTAFLASWSY